MRFKCSFPESWYVKKVIKSPLGVSQNHTWSCLKARQNEREEGTNRVSVVRKAYLQHAGYPAKGKV